VDDDGVDEGGEDRGDVDVDREVDALGHGAGDDLPGNRRFRLLSALRAHTKAPYKSNLLWETRRALDRPWAGPDRGGGGAESPLQGAHSRAPKGQNPQG
jgi:hypothetical protein